MEKFQRADKGHSKEEKLSVQSPGDRNMASSQGSQLAGIQQERQRDNRRGEQEGVTEGAKIRLSQKTAGRDSEQRHNICRFVFYKGHSWLRGGEYIGKASLRAPRLVRSKMEPPREEMRAAAEMESNEQTPQTLGRQQQPVLVSE